MIQEKLSDEAEVYLQNEWKIFCSEISVYTAVQYRHNKTYSWWSHDLWRLAPSNRPQLILKQTQWWRHTEEHSSCQAAVMLIHRKSSWLYLWARVAWGRGVRGTLYRVKMFGYWPICVWDMRSASTVAAEEEVAWWDRPPGWEEVEEADDDVDEPWMTLLNQCSTRGWDWYGDEEEIRPCRRSEPSSSDADDVSVGWKTRSTLSWFINHFNRVSDRMTVRGTTRRVWIKLL